MKKNILFSMCASLLLLASCDYNEDNFPGFDELTKPTDVQNVEVSLADGDYKKIATLNANRELALSKDPEGQTFLTALDAVSKNKYFTEDAPAVMYLPAYIDSIQPYLSDGSKVTVAYKNAENLPEYLSDFGSVSAYTLSSDDYKAVWGENISATFLSPSSVGKIPAVLAEAVKEPADGAMRMVNYAYSETEPSTGGSTGGGSEPEPEPEPTYAKISDVLQVSSGSFDVKGEVVAVNAKSFIVKDATGLIRVYRGSLPVCSVGDIVVVSGDVENKQLLTRFRSKATYKIVGRSTTFAYPTPKVMTAADMDAYLTSAEIKYVTYEGVYAASGTNYNITIDGATTAIGSLTDPLMADAGWAGETVVITGYLAGVSGTPYVNTFVTSIVKKGETPATPIGVVSMAPVGAQTVQGVVAATYGRGFMLTDGSGNILVYENTEPSAKVGDVVTVSGTTTIYKNSMQFGNTGLTVTKKDNFKSNLVTPVAIVMDTEKWNTYLENPHAVYATLTGTLKISSGYYSVVLEEMPVTECNLSYIDVKMAEGLVAGDKITVEGFLIGNKVSGDNKYVDMMTASLKKADAPATKAFAMTRAAVTPNTSAIYRYNAASKTWKEYTTTEASVVVLQPADYDKMGSSFLNKPSETLPVYLQQTYPYAQKGKTVAAVYYIKDMAIATTEYIYDGVTWVETAEAMPTTIIFVKNQGVWNEAKIYFLASFADGDDGGFVAHDIELSGATKVWALDTKYGYWKGSGYSGGKKKTESWLVSPEIDLKKSAAPVLKFDVVINYLDGAELKDHIAVFVTTGYDDGDIVADNWKELTVEGWPKGDSWTFSNAMTSISEYKDKTIRIAFRYKSNTEVATTVEIKNFTVQE